MYRPKWQIAVSQLERAIGNGVRLAWVTFDEEYGTVPRFWFELDRLGLRGVGEVRSDFHAWATLPAWRSGRAEHASRHVKDLARYSPVFTQQPWQKIRVKTTTRGKQVWKGKAARVRLVAEHKDHGPSVPTDREYWLIVAHNGKTGETKYIVSNAPATASLQKLLEVALARWHVEKWFERAKQEAGFGAFEVRTYPGLIRHWLVSRMVMLFLAEQTQRLRGEKSAHHVGAGGGRRERDRVVRLGASCPQQPTGLRDKPIPSAA